MPPCKTKNATLASRMAHRKSARHDLRGIAPITHFAAFADLAHPPQITVPEVNPFSTALLPLNEPR
ncbi:MAG: hypothetical protein QOG67_3013 [Verrucomicrobiota bacterium]